MAKTIVVANWKMNPPTFRDAKKLLASTAAAAKKAKKSAVIVAPPAIFLRELSALFGGRKIAYALQNAHFEAAGSHTGEISLSQGKDARARYVLIGHAERRMIGETNDETRKKVEAALSVGFTPILCVGESQRTDDGQHFVIVREQLQVALEDISPKKLGSILVTYEPLWTIGAKDTMNPREMHQMAIFMRKCVVDTHGEAGRALKILYGGSVDEKNVVAMLREGDVRGFLVGRASISAVEFAKLLRALET